VGEKEIVRIKSILAIGFVLVLVLSGLIGCISGYSGEVINDDSMVAPRTP